MAKRSSTSTLCVVVAATLGLALLIGGVAIPARAAGIDDDVPAVDEAEIGETSGGGLEGPAESSAGIIRLWGNGSAQASAKLALAGKGQWAGGTAIIATNKSFKDALSAAPVSYAMHWPILLATSGAKLAPEVISALKELGISRVYIVGGTRAVKPYVETQLKNNGIVMASRKWGRNGIETSRVIADWGLELGLTADGMGFATAQKANDELAGAALLGKRGSVLLLANNYTGEDAIENYDRLSDYGNLSFVDDNLLHMSHGYVFGGTAALSNDFMAYLPRSFEARDARVRRYPCCRFRISGDIDRRQGF